MSFVLDASVTMSWAFEDEADAYSDIVLDKLRKSHAITPDIWALEIANTLLVGERTGRLNESKIAYFLGLIAALKVNVIPVGLDLATGTILILAREHKLSSYDAAYLELAMREGVPLATCDDRLKAAAKRAGLALVSA